MAKEYDAPIFELHVNLLGEIIQSEEDAIGRLQQLALRQRPFSINLSTVDC